MNLGGLWLRNCCWEIEKWICSCCIEQFETTWLIKKWDVRDGRAHESERPPSMSWECKGWKGCIYWYIGSFETSLQKNSIVWWSFRQGKFELSIINPVEGIVSQFQAKSCSGEGDYILFQQSNWLVRLIEKSFILIFVFRTYAWAQILWSHRFRDKKVAKKIGEHDISKNSKTFTCTFFALNLEHHRAAGLTHCYVNSEGCGTCNLYILM